MGRSGGSCIGGTTGSRSGSVGLGTPETSEPMVRVVTEYLPSRTQPHQVVTGSKLMPLSPAAAAVGALPFLLMAHQDAAICWSANVEQSVAATRIPSPTQKSIHIGSGQLAPRAISWLARLKQHLGRAVDFAFPGQEKRPAAASAAWLDRGSLSKRPRRRVRPRGKSAVRGLGAAASGAHLTQPTRPFLLRVPGRLGRKIRRYN